MKVKKRVSLSKSLSKVGIKREIKISLSKLKINNRRRMGGEENS